MTLKAPTPNEKETSRIEAFSDGVFSIAMTLLVLDLKVPALGSGPPAAAEVWAALARQWPSYLAFVTSFATVLIMWINHHGIFTMVHRCDGRLMFANGFLLLLVTVVPFPTDLLAQYLRTPAASTACAVYSGVFVLISIAYGLILLATLHGERLLLPGFEAEVKKRMRDCFAVGTPLYFSAMIFAFFLPPVSMAICSGLWLFWAVRHQR